jgi:hypothetical protein
MTRLILRVVAAGFVAVGATGCGSPFLHSAAVVSTLDPGLSGEWASSEPVEVRAVIASSHSIDAGGEGYNVSLTVHDKGEIKTTLQLDLMLTEIGGSGYMDLFLARPERDKLVGAYGFLAIPVHQTMKFVRTGDTLTVWSFRGDWLDDYAPRDDFSHERVTVGGAEVPMVTASTDRIRRLLAQHGDDPNAFANPMVFHRIPPTGLPQ